MAKVHHYCNEQREAHVTLACKPHLERNLINYLVPLLQAKVRRQGKYII